MKPERTYFINGQIKSEGWMNEVGEDHRLDGPAYRSWYDDGQLRCEEWCINGLRHKLDGPAFRYWHKGRVEETWWIAGVNYKTEAEFLVAVDLYKANEIAELF